jgi:hypothetical protein
MTDATISGPVSVPRTQTVVLPKPQPFGSPVLISDVATPLGGDTLLSLILKRMARDDQP